MSDDKKPIISYMIIENNQEKETEKEKMIITNAGKRECKVIEDCVVVNCYPNIKEQENNEQENTKD